MKILHDWIVANNLDAIFTDEITFTINKKDYVYICPKNGKIVDEDFNLIISDEERDRILVDYYCFAFGGKIYYTSTQAEKTQLNILKHIGIGRDISGFPYLGIHGGYELCNGSRSYEDWCRKAQFLGIDVLGICERNTLAGILKFQLACQQFGIKSIIGQTITVKNSNNDRYSIKVFVKNDDGWKSLLQINRCINVDNSEQYIDEDILFNKSNLIVILSDDMVLTTQLVDQYLNAFGQDLYFQIDPVEYRSPDKDLKKLQKMKLYLDCYRDKIAPLLLCDSYYLDREDAHIKKVLNQIGNKGFDYQSQDQWFKSLDEVVEQLYQTLDTYRQKDVLIERCVENVYEICDRIDFKIEIGKLKLPQYKMIEQESSLHSSNEELLWGLLNQGLEYKIIAKGKNLDIYLDRLGIEIDVIQKGGFVDYFLILSDVVRWCKKQGILTGLGRGSAAGSLVAYLLDITKVDPIQYDLLFERFLSESRIRKIEKRDFVIFQDENNVDCELSSTQKILISRNNQIIEIYCGSLQNGDEIQQML